MKVSYFRPLDAFVSRLAGTYILLFSPDREQRRLSSLWLRLLSFPSCLPSSQKHLLPDLLDLTRTPSVAGNVSSAGRRNQCCVDFTSH